MITTIANIPPMVCQYFNSNLLRTPLSITPEYYDREFKEILEKAYRKYNTKCIGKMDQIKKVAEEFDELYERKKIEEENYETERKNKKKKPTFSVTGNTLRFKRMDPW